MLTRSHIVSTGITLALVAALVSPVLAESTTDCSTAATPALMKECLKEKRAGFKTDMKELRNTNKEMRKETKEGMIGECHTKHLALKESAVDGMVKWADVEALLTCIKSTHETMKGMREGQHSSMKDMRSGFRDQMKKDRDAMKGMRHSSSSMSSSSSSM